MNESGNNTEYNGGKPEVNIIGAGLAGLSAALTLARMDIPCRLISPMPSERAQSVMAEGGINASLDTMRESDSPDEHFADTMKGGVYLADPNAENEGREACAAQFRRAKEKTHCLCKKQYGENTDDRSYRCSAKI